MWCGSVSSPDISMPSPPPRCGVNLRRWGRRVAEWCAVAVVVPAPAPQREDPLACPVAWRRGHCDRADRPQGLLQARLLVDRIQRSHLRTCRNCPGHPVLAGPRGCRRLRRGADGPTAVRGTPAHGARTETAQMRCGPATGHVAWAASSSSMPGRVPRASIRCEAALGSTALPAPRSALTTLPGMHLGIATLIGLPLGAPALVPPQCFEEASGFDHSLPHFLGPALVEGCCGHAATAAWDEGL